MLHLNLCCILKLENNAINRFSKAVFFLSFYFPDSENVVIVKKIDVEILLDLHIFRSQESEKVVF